MIDDKNQIIRSSRSYAVGGDTDTCFDGGDKKCRKTRRIKVRSSGNNDGSGALALGIGAGFFGAAGLGLKKMLKKEKVGGPVKTLTKKQNGGPAITKPMPSPRPKTYPRGLAPTPKPQINAKGNPGKEGYKPYARPSKPSMSTADYKSKAIARYGSEENARSAKAIQKKGGAVKTIKATVKRRG